MVELKKYKIFWNPYDLEHLCELLEYDGPIITLFRNKITNEPYLYVWVDFDDDSHRWMVLSTTVELLRKIASNEVSVGNLVPMSFTNNENIYFTDYNIDVWYMMKPANVPEEYLQDITPDDDDKMEVIAEVDKLNVYLKTIED